MPDSTSTLSSTTLILATWSAKWAHRPAGGRRHTERLESTSAVRVETQHDVEIRWIGASEAWFITGIGRTLHVVTAEVAAAVTANADSINFANLIHTGTNPIRLSMGGGSRSRLIWSSCTPAQV